MPSHVTADVVDELDVSLFLIELDGRPVLFVHIPKCGGTSIRTNRDIGGGYRIYDPDPLWPTNIPSFAFLRDETERIKSCWRDWKFNRRLTSMTYDDFVSAYVGDLTNVDDPSSVQHHLAPSNHPMHGLQHAKFIGDFNHLHRDFDLFCSQNEIPLFELPHLRQSLPLC